MYERGSGREKDLSYCLCASSPGCRQTSHHSLASLLRIQELKFRPQLERDALRQFQKRKKKWKQNQFVKSWGDKRTMKSISTAFWTFKNKKRKNKFQYSDIKISSHSLPSNTKTNHMKKCSELIIKFSYQVSLPSSLFLTSPAANQSPLSWRMTLRWKSQILINK